MATCLSNPLDSREIWFTNMVLLGFDPGAFEEKFKVSFSRDMFAHISKKGMEVVMHFLFSRLDPQLAHDEFRGCWPVHDKKQEQQFRKICSNWLARIAKEQPESKLPRLAASLLLSPGGDKFYHFLLRFSSHILRTVCLREAKSEEKQVCVSSFLASPGSVLHAAQKDVTAAALKGHVVRHMQHVTGRMKQVSALHQEWESFTSELVSDYRACSKEGKDLAKQLSSLQEEQKQAALIRHGTPSRSLQASSASDEKVLSLTAEVSAMKRQSRMKKARDFWRSVEDFISRSSHQREVVDSIIQGQTNKYSFDARDVVFQIPEMVRQEYEQLTRQGRAGNTYEAGKLNLISLVKVWNCALRVLRTQMEENNVPSFEAETQHISQELHAHRANLAAAQKLRASLHDFHESVTSSIQQLEERLQKMRAAAVPLEGRQPASSEAEGPAVLHIPAITIPSLGMDLLPPSPEKSVAASPDSKWKKNIAFTADNMSTPEAVQNISRSVHLATQQKHTEPSKIPTARKKDNRLTTATTLPSSQLVDLSIFEDSPRNVTVNTFTTPIPSSVQQHYRANQTYRPSSKRTFTMSEKMAKTETTLKKTRPTKPTPRVGRAMKTREDTAASEKSKSERSFSKKADKKLDTSSMQTPLLQSFPQAHDLLADQIASAVAAADVEGASPNTPDTDIHSLIDPISAMGVDAFVSMDKISRTPLAKKPVSRLQAMQSTLSPVLQSPVTNSSAGMMQYSPHPANSSAGVMQYSPHSTTSGHSSQESSPRLEVESCFQEHSVSPDQPLSAEQASSPEVSVSGSASPESLQASSGGSVPVMFSSTKLDFSAQGISGSPLLKHTSGESLTPDMLISETLPELGSTFQTPSSVGEISEASLLSSNRDEHDSYSLPTANLLSFTPQSSSHSQPHITPHSLMSARRVVFEPKSTPDKPLRDFSPAFSKASPLVQSQKTPQTHLPPPSSIASITRNSVDQRQTLEPSPLQPGLSTPNQSPGLFTSIEPPTPFRHADFDLDSSSSSFLSGEEMFSELDGGTSKQPSNGEDLLSLKRTNSPIVVPMHNRQSQSDDVGDLLNLCDSSTESLTLHSSLVVSSQEQLIDLETS